MTNWAWKRGQQQQPCSSGVGDLSGLAKRFQAILIRPAEPLMQHQVLPNGFGSLALQSQLFGNPASVAVVDFEVVNSVRFHSDQRCKPKAVMTKAH